MPPCVFSMYLRLFACLIVCSVLWCINASDPVVKIYPRTTPAFFIEGRRLELTCTVYNSSDVQIVWMKNENELEADEYQIDSWAAEDSDGKTRNVRLTKSVAGQSDVAEFRCSAGNSDQIVHTSSFYVFIRDANVTEGALTTLTCKTDLIYADKSVTWLKGKIPLVEVPDLKGRLEFGNETVSFKNTKLTDSGVYTCHMEIGPTKELSQVFEENVVLQGKPYITDENSPGTNQQVTNTSITLKCPAGGHPVPEVFWFREGEVLERSDRIRLSSLNGQADGLLEILNTTEADIRQYSCTAENALGKASMTFELKDSSPSSSGFKRDTGFLNACGTALYISAVTIATSWFR